MSNFPGNHDWNGNGRQDAFDHYMDHKASGSESAHDSRQNSTSPGNTGSNLFKSLLTIGLCLAGFVLPAAADMGTLGAAICLLTAVALGAALWRT